LISLLTHLIPISLGFFAKLSAIKSKQSHDEQKILLNAFVAKSKSISSAREFASKENRGAQWNRRFLIVVILSLVAIYPLAGLLGVETVIPVEYQGFSLLGLIEFGGGTRFQEVVGLYKFDEIFQWATIIIEFYFGGQLAKSS
jgi:hypothetical protein|tara:strand:+ start:243 stop:671 length:429 start_codon:yes stop_codon:yes gene_type:complete